MSSGRVMPGAADGWRDNQWWLELFVLANVAGLAADIYLAHSQNAFRHGAEYIPFVFSIAGTVALGAVLPLRRRRPAVWRYTGHIVGWISIAIGTAGVMLHLESQFFYERTIRSLTYSAPFAAPLAYTGLGLLLIANRMVAAASREWGQWLLLLTLGGFVGNFVFSLADHAQNGFFNPMEWIPVVASAAAIGFLLAPFIVTVGRPYLRLLALILVAQALVGMLGFVLHVVAIAGRPADTWFERILSGAPPMAPLLFPNLAILGLLAVWQLWRTTPGKGDVRW